MKKLLIISSIMFLFVTPALAEYGSGGPIMLMSFNNYDPLSSYLQGYGFDAIETNMGSWGGAGSGFLNDTTALGGIFYGGLYTSFEDENQVNFRKLLGVITIETYLLKKSRLTGSAIIGFGVGAINMAMSGANNGHFLLLNTALCGGLSFKIRVMDVSMLELFALYMYIPETDWSTLSGDASAPSRMSLSGLEVGIGLRFGGGGGQE